MGVIAVEESQTIADIETLLNRMDQETAPDLLLPTYLRNWQLGGLSALIQFLITWVRKYPQGRVLTHIHGEQELNRLESFCDTDHGLIATLMAKDLRTRTGESSVRRYAIDNFARQRVSRMFKPGMATPLVERLAEVQRGPKFFIPCIDHLSPENAFPPLLYHPFIGDQHPVVRGDEDFRILTGEILQKTAGTWGTSDQLASEFQTRISDILWELFKNTDEWAYTDLFDRPWPRSVRGIRIEFHHNTYESFESSAEGSLPLLSFVRRACPTGASQERFLEVSVFDSGLGLALRMAQKRGLDLAQIGPDSEYELVMKCLSWRGTTSEEPLRGSGLYLVMEALTAAKGFLRIRTGRLSLFRDLGAYPFDPGLVGSKEPFLLDWDTGNNERISRYPVAGTLLTMFVPIAKRGS